MQKPIVNGLAGSVALLGVYFSLVTFISGWEFAQNQFSQFWYFIVALAAGFGVQLGLYARLKNTHHPDGSKKMVAASGAASTAAMVSCCAHYLVNVLPVIGASGLVTVISQYQIELFWLGLVFNLWGIYFIARKIKKTPAYEEV